LFIGALSLQPTGWRRPIGCLELQVISRKRATNYRALLRKMTCKEKASNGSPPPFSVGFKFSIYVYIYTLSQRYVAVDCFAIFPDQHMCVCMCVCVCVCVCVCACVCVCMCVCVCVRLCVHVCVQVYVPVVVNFLSLFV